jgi:hypothetical protein
MSARVSGRSKPATKTQRTFDRTTGELNGSLSGSARFTSLLLDHGKRSVFAANRLFWAHGVHADLKMQMAQSSAARETGLLCFDKRNGCCILKQKLLIMRNLRLFDSAGRPISIYEPLFVY